MRRYTENDVLKRLRILVKKDGQTKTAAALGLSSQMVNYVIHGKRSLSASLALRLGFIELERPKLYVRSSSGRG